MAEDILLKQSAGNPVDLGTYLQQGGYRALVKAVKEMTPAGVIEEIKASGLRGRGGAGFPTGRKWDRVATHREKEHYVVCNAGEHEPGTFKDRYLLNHHPHRMLEGLLIASYAVQARETFLFMNEAFGAVVDHVKGAIEEARRAGYVGKNIQGSGFSCDIQVFLGPDLYVAGEETAMLEVMQGRKATPQHKPPFYPTEYGLHGKPTVVNNVETLSNVPPIILNGGAGFAKIGAPGCPGTMYFSLSGDVERPGIYELPLGVSLRELIEKHGGGVSGGRRLKAVYPGGPSFPFLTEKEIDVAMEFDSLKKAGAGLGSAGVIVVDETRCMVRKILEFSTFFQDSSCGKCPPCKMGTQYLYQIMKRIEDGEGKPEDIPALEQLCGFVKGRGDCTVITGASVAVQSGLRLFRQEFLDHIDRKGCPFPA